MVGAGLMAGGVAVGQVVGANEVIPAPAPRSELGRWTDGPGRFRVELDAGGAKLRGWDYKAEARAVAQAEGAGGGQGGGPAAAGLLVSSTGAAGGAAEKGVPGGGVFQRQPDDD